MTTITPHAGKEGFHPLIGHTEGPSQTVVGRRQRRYTPVERFTQAAAGAVLGLLTLGGAEKLATDQGTRTALVSEFQQVTHDIQSLAAPDNTTQQYLAQPKGSGAKPEVTSTPSPESGTLLSPQMKQRAQEWFAQQQPWTTNNGPIKSTFKGEVLTPGAVVTDPHYNNGENTVSLTGKLTTQQEVSLLDGSKGNVVEFMIMHNGKPYVILFQAGPHPRESMNNVENPVSPIDQGATLGNPGNLSEQDLFAQSIGLFNSVKHPGALATAQIPTSDTALIAWLEGKTDILPPGVYANAGQFGQVTLSPQVVGVFPVAAQLLIYYSPGN